MSTILQRYRVWRQMRRQAALMRVQTPTSRGLGRVLRRTSGKSWAAIGRGVRYWLDYFASGRRRWRDLLWGLPAVLALVGLVAITALGHVRQTNGAKRYWAQGHERLRAGDAEGALLLLQKALFGKNVNRRDILFSLARAYEASGDSARATAVMESLAPANAPGYPPAHRYLAVRIAAQVGATRKPGDLETWYWHLSHADQPRSPDLRKAWGMYCLASGDLERAAEHYRTAAQEEPTVWLKVAEIEARLNDMETARRTLATARRQLEQTFIRDPSNAQNRLAYATSLFYMGRLPQAERLLKEGLAEEDNASFRQLLSAVFVRMYDVESSSDGGIGTAFPHLQRALEYDPGYTPALTRLVAVARVSEEQLEASRETMRRMIANGNASGMAHLALGSLERMAGRHDLAALNMRQALALGGQLPVVANNLAFLMAQGEDADLLAALQFADQAVEAEPQNPQFLDTRAFIYFQMGEFAKAAVDYQKALERAPEPRPLQQQLAVIYDKLGDPEMAEQFRGRARILQQP